MTKSEWKQVNILRTELLQRLCQKVLDDLQKELNKEGKIPHERYLYLYKSIRTKDKMIADAFNEWSKNNAWIQVRFWIKYQLLTKAEFEALPEELTRSINLEKDWGKDYRFYGE